MTDPVPPRNSAMAVAASALKAQQSRMREIAENIANAQSTAQVAGGEPSRRQIPVFQAREIDGATGVTLAEVRPDMGDFRSEYDPSHPAANAEGYVLRPNVDTLVEAWVMSPMTLVSMSAKPGWAGPAAGAVGAAPPWIAA